MRGRGPRRPSPSPPSAARPYSARCRRLRGRAAARPSAVRMPANSRPRPALDGRSASRRRAWRAPAAAAGSTCRAWCRKYVAGAIGNTAQIGSTPYVARWSSTNWTITSLGGRAPPGQNMRRPSARSHSRVSIRDCRVPVPSGAGARRSSKPPRWPVSRSAWRTQFRSVSPVQAELARDRRDRGPLRWMLGTMLADHPNGPLSYLS